MVENPVGLRAKNHCADEDQQQFSGLGWTVYSPIFDRQPLFKHAPAGKKMVGGVIFYTIRVISKASRRLFLTRTSC
jgi:hypothetical protein